MKLSSDIRVTTTLAHHLQAQIGYRYKQEFGKSQLKQSVRIHEVYEIYNKEYFIFYYNFKLCTTHSLCESEL